MKNTNERIEEIVKEYSADTIETAEISKQILRLELENLVTCAKLEQLRGE